MPQPHSVARAADTAGDPRPVRTVRGGRARRGHGGSHGRLPKPAALAGRHADQGAAGLPDPALVRGFGGRGPQHRPPNPAGQRFREPRPGGPRRGARRSGWQRPRCRARPQRTLFQALDEDGLAITSMRSATQFQPCEQATCLACHEPKAAAPLPGSGPPLALRRAPSRLDFALDGANPFSYPRLVQPVLERHCVHCHTREAEKAPSLQATRVLHRGRGGMDVPTTYYASYVSLAPQFGFYSYGGRDWNDPKWYRTTPGEFGARASRLYALLEAGHHGVCLSPADWARLTLWLDSCSLFYGVYEKEGGEAQLRGEVPLPTLE
ncbi:MAG: hypothetical protein HS113_20380 [Verrucomicrobiales bacterium]|nr:hypothetical protein [Verrucomicrobiales bacterium]